MKNSFFLVSLLGWLGVISRYGIDFFFEKKNWNDHFPWSILIINILGSFLAGMLYKNFREQLPQLYIPLLVGFMGGFTTFSSYSLKTVVYLQAGEISKALLYLIGSPLLGLLCCYVGMKA